MAKALTQSDIKSMAERWATHTRKLEKIEADREAELAPVKAAFQKKAAPINEKYDALVDPLQAKADELEEAITEWLRKQKKSIRIESRSAVAEFIKGSKLGNRVVDAFKFVAMASERKIKDYWSHVNVTIKDAEKLLGKDDLDAICSQPKVVSEIVNLELK